MTKNRGPVMRRVGLALLLLFVMGADGRTTAEIGQRSVRGGRITTQDEQRTGTSMVLKVDVGGKSLVVDDEVYFVREDTKITRSSGMLAELGDIRAPQPGPNQILALDQSDFIKFEAKRSGRNWVMTWIEILPGPTE